MKAVTVIFDEVLHAPLLIIACSPLHSKPLDAIEAVAVGLFSAVANKHITVPKYNEAHPYSAAYCSKMILVGVPATSLLTLLAEYNLMRH